MRREDGRKALVGRAATNGRFTAAMLLKLGEDVSAQSARRLGRERIGEADDAVGSEGGGRVDQWSLLERRRVAQRRFFDECALERLLVALDIIVVVVDDFAIDDTAAFR